MIKQLYNPVSTSATLSPINRAYQSAHLKYENYKPREVEPPIKNEYACAQVSFSDVQPPHVYKSHILNGPIQ